MTEEWRDVIGYEGHYQVSDLGRVKSLRRPIHRKDGRVRMAPECILRPYVMPAGHLQVALALEGRSKSLLVHLLVLEAFRGARPGNYLEWHGCHRDGTPSNNKLENLRWDTRSGNELDKIEHGRSNRGVRNRAVKLTEEQAAEIKRRLAAGEESHAEIAKDYEVTRELVSAIKRGRAWSWLMA